MNWKLLADEQLTKYDLLILAAAQRRLTVIPEQLSTLTGLDTEYIRDRLKLLVDKELMMALPNRFTAFRVVNTGLTSPEPEKVAPKPANSALTAKSIEAALEAAEKSKDWTDRALLGLFYRYFRQSFSIDYRGGSFKEDLRHIQLLMEAVNGMSYWCIKAFFEHKELAWVKGKTLDFLSNPSHVTKYVIPIAVDMRRTAESKPEWQAETKPVAGTLNDPLARGR